jgi:hypothetical protein
MKTIIFSDDAVASATELPSAIDASYSSQQPPDKPYYWQMIKSNNLSPEMEDFFVYKFTYTIKQSYPVKSLGLRLIPKVHRHNGEQFDEKGTQISSEIRCESTGGNDGEPAINKDSIQSFSWKPRKLLEESNQGDYNFFVIEQAAYVKEISDEIASWSTRDDSSTESASRTYRFQELVNTIVDVHIQDRIIPRISPRVYLTVANR